jgi:ribonuclease BN (tRNA processing enzyme)
MCDAVGQVYALMSRRSPGAEPHRAPGQAPRGDPLDSREAERHRTRLVLLGTAGGPVWHDPRQGIASAVVVDGNVYLVDCGEGVGRQYRRANFAPFEGRRTLRGLRAILLTHLHSDHCVDYFNLWLFGWFNGIGLNPHVVQVYGPGNRGSLPAPFGPEPEPAVQSPDNPTPGTVEMTRYLLQAYAADINDRMRDDRRPALETRFRAHDIPLPSSIVMGANTNPAPDMEPIDVYEDENVKVRAILVPHPPTFPSFAYRFDSADGSIVFSGDTTVSTNLIKLARAADILVHEVIDREWVESRFEPPMDSFEQAAVNHLLSSHTTIEQVGEVAERAGVGTLVLNHLVPADNPVGRWLEAKRGFSGRLVVGEDLMQLGLGEPRRAG